MNISSKAGTQTFQRILHFFLFIIGLIFFLLFNSEASFRNSLMVSPAVDGTFLGLLAIIFFLRNGFSGIHFLVLSISYSIHAITANQITDFRLFYILSYFLVSFLLVLKPDTVYAVVIYHIGLSFESSMTRTTGLGMQMSFYCANQTSLLIAASVHALLHKNKVFKPDLRFALVFFLGLFMIGAHSIQVKAGATSEVMAFTVSVILFLLICRDDQEKGFCNNSMFIIALLSGSLIAYVASVANLFLVSESIGEIFRRRAMISGIHPNRIATCALASIWLFNLIKTKNFQTSKNALIIVNLALVSIIILTGARLILAYTIISYLVFMFFNQNYSLSRNLKMAGAITFVIALTRIFLNFRLTELLKNERIMIWYSALKNISGSLWQGKGAFSFSYLPQFIPPDMTLWSYDWNYPHTHQLLLELMLWGGIPLLAIFIFLLIKAFKDNKSLTFRIGLIVCVISGLTDFSWGTGTMIATGALYLFYSNPDTQWKTEFRNSMVATLLLIGLFLFSITGLLKQETGIFQIEAAKKSFAARSDIWQKQISTGAELLKNDPSIKMHKMLWEYTTGKPVNQLLKNADAITEIYSDYYAVWFFKGRLEELSQNPDNARKAYRLSLNLEPRDLTGIRHARLLISDCKGSKVFTKTQKAAIICEIVKRGHLGLPMAINHPEYGDSIKAVLQEKLKFWLNDQKLPEIDRFFILKNAAEWGTIAEKSYIDDLLKANLPDWAKDELESLVLEKKYLDQFSHDREKTRGLLKESLKQNPDSAVCKKIAEIALEKKLFDLAVEAYKLHRKKYNMRNKNYEDLKMQFIAAKAYIGVKKFEKALFELERLAAYDQLNPFIAIQRAEVHKALKETKKAQYWKEMAKKLVVIARSLPFCRDKANNFNWPEGDHWTYTAEKTFRSSDPESYRYCKEEWQNAVTEINSL
jgi:hypothetical protein